MPCDDQGDHLTREPLVGGRAVFIGETLRRTWSQRTRDYAAVAAGHGAHTAMLVAKVRPRPGERVLNVATGSGVSRLRRRRQSVRLATFWRPIHP